MKHTKGLTPWPWCIQAQGTGEGFQIMGKDNTFIAVMDEGTFEDADLLAAAPGLLEACKTMRDFYGDSGWMVDNGLSVTLMDLFGKHYNTMCAAIKAAEGGE